MGLIRRADVDRFKQINDGYGHDAGDAALVGVGERVRAGVARDAVDRALYDAKAGGRDRVAVAEGVR